MNLVCDPQFVLHGLQGILLDGVSASLDGRLAAVVLSPVRVATKIDDLECFRQSQIINRKRLWLVFFRSPIKNLN